MVKWVNPGKGVAPSATPWCSSYRKGSLRVTLDNGRQLYLFYVKDSYQTVERIAEPVFINEKNGSEEQISDLLV